MTEFFTSIDITTLISDSTTWLASRILLIVVGIIVFRLGLKIIKIIVNSIDKLMKKSKIDKGLKHFLHWTVAVLLKVALVIWVAVIIWIPASSFIAIVWAAGLAIGLALQGSLSNVAWGLLILFFRPLKVGEYIEAQSVWWTVEEINIFSTILLTPQGQMVSVPNGQLANGNIKNYSRLKKRRIDISVWIAYDADIQKAREVLLPVLEKNSDILSDPKPEILVENLGGSSVDLLLRWFLPTEKYWENYYKIREQAKVALDKAGIEIPFPQRVVHLKK